MTYTYPALPGSSPRMRGSLSVTKYGINSTRIIPAHAGLTPRGPSSAAAQRDHPRACGAHLKLKDVATMLSGSSPRMRGSQQGDGATATKPGIIPAHAGLTRVLALANLESRDHPRACGAHLIHNALRRPEWGSSPRMRGSQVRDNRRDAARGIIPAHAGLTTTGHTRSIKRWDHPRACGAHLVSLSLSQQAAGSSPRMRGSH